MLRLLPRQLLGCATTFCGVAAAALVGLGGIGIWAGTGGGERFIERRIERIVSRQTTGGQLRIGDLEIGRGGIRIDDVVLLDSSSRPLISIGRVIAEIDGWALFTGVVRLPHVRAEAVAVDLTADENGVLDLSRLFGGPSETPSDKPFRLPVPIQAPDITLRSVNVRYDKLVVVGATPVRSTAFELSGLDGHLALDGKGDRIALSELVLAAQIAAPGPLGVRAHGDVVWDGSDGLAFDGVLVEIPHGSASATGNVGEVTDLGVTIDRLEMRALDPLAGDAGIGGVWSGSAAATGSNHVFTVTAGLRGLEASQGAVAASLVIDRSAAVPTWELDANLASFHVEDIYTPIAQPIVLDGVITATGRGTSPAKDLTLDGRWRGGHQDVYGQDIDAIDARFAMKDGVLSIIEGYVDGIVGALRLDGTIDLLNGPIAIMATGDLSPERLAALGVTGLDGNGTVGANVTLDLKADPIVVEVQGQAKYAPFLYPNVRMAELTAPFQVTVLNGDVTGTAGLYGSGIEASGLTAATLRSDGLRFEVTTDKVTTVTGPVHLATIAYDRYLTAESGDVALQVEMANGHLAVDAGVELGEHTLIGRPGTDGLVAIHMLDDSLAYDVDLYDFGRMVLDTRGRFELATSEVLLETVAFAPTPRTTWVTRRPAHFTLTDGGMTDADLAIGSDLGEIEILGTLGTKGALDGTVAAHGFQLDHLAELYPDQLDGLAGLLDLSLALTGDASDPTVRGALDLKGLFAAGGVRWLDVSGPILLEHHRLVPDLKVGVAGDPLAVVSGSLPMSGGLADIAVDYDGATSLEVALTPGGFERLVHVSPALDGQEVPAGRFSAVIQLSDTLRDPVLRLAGVSELEVPGWSQRGRAEFDVTRRASELSFQSDLREGLATRALVVGTGVTRLGEALTYIVEGGAAPNWSDLELYLDDMTVSTALVGMPAPSIAAATGSPVTLTGEVIGGFMVTGSPSRPVVDGAVNWLNPSIDGHAMDGAYLAIVPQGGPPGSAGAGDAGYGLDLSLTFSEGGSLDVKGAVPVTIDLEREWADWSTADLALDVSGAGVPLALLSAVNPNFRGGEGRLDVTGTVGGTVADPQPELDVVGKAGELEYTALGITAQDIDFQLGFDNKRVRLDHLDFVLVPSYRFQASRITEGNERPRVHVAGTAQLEEWAPTALSAKVDLSGGPWLSATESTTVRANGEVMVSGAWPTLAVTGDLDVVYGRVVLDAAALLEAAPLEPSPELVIVRGEADPLPPRIIEPSLISDFDVNVNVDLHRSLELSLAIPFVDDLGGLGAAVTRVDVGTRLGGQVDIRMQNGEPTLVGEVDIVEGKVHLLRSSFTMREGTITFAGGDPSTDANLDLNAEMAVAGATVDMHITGTPKQPEIALSSEEYPDRTQQMTILLTGQVPEDLTSENGAGAAEALAGVLFNSLLGGQSLGTFTVEPDGSVRVGVPVTPSVYVASTLSPQTDPNENSLTVEAEWTLAPRVVASGGLGDQVSWGDVYWEIRF